MTTPITDSQVNSADRMGDRDVVPAKLARQLEEENNRLGGLLVLGR